MFNKSSFELGIRNHELWGIKRKRLFFLIIPLFLILNSCFIIPPPALAQEFNVGIAKTQQVVDEEAQDGDIVALSDKAGQLVRSARAYDEKMYGVIVLNPLLVYKDQIRETDIPVLRQGEVLLNVTTINGPIAPGDYLTTSVIAGKGQKASDPTGSIIGIAIGSFEEKDGTVFSFQGTKYFAGKVKAGLGIQTPAIAKTRGGVIGVLESVLVAFLSNVRQSAGSDRLMRYLIAGLVATITIVINFNHFGKNISGGIESVGRNPLSRAAVQSMILLNIMLIAAVSIGGVILSLAIISF